MLEFGLVPDDFDGNNFLSLMVKAFERLTERTFSQEVKNFESISDLILETHIVVTTLIIVAIVVRMLSRSVYFVGSKTQEIAHIVVEHFKLLELGEAGSAQEILEDLATAHGQFWLIHMILQLYLCLFVLLVLDLNRHLFRLMLVGLLQDLGALSSGSNVTVAVHNECFRSTTIILPLTGQGSRVYVGLITVVLAVLRQVDNVERLDRVSLLTPGAGSRVAGRMRETSCTWRTYCQLGIVVVAAQMCILVHVLVLARRELNHDLIRGGSDRHKIIALVRGRLVSYAASAVLLDLSEVHLLLLMGLRCRQLVNFALLANTDYLAFDISEAKGARLLLMHLLVGLETIDCSLAPVRLVLRSAKLVLLILLSEVLIHRLLGICIIIHLNLVQLLTVSTELLLHEACGGNNLRLSHFIL